MTAEDKQHDEYIALSMKKAGMPALTAEESARPYAKYFYEAIESPDPKHLAVMDEPCDASKAISPLQMNELLNPGNLDVEIGWCNLSDGSGFIANRTVYPDATAEMIDWWFAWHPLEDLRYRLWYPPQHGGIMVSDEDRRRLLDSSIPVAERNWGVLHHVVENVNCGMENVDIQFMSPAEFGFDMNRWKHPEVATFAGGQGWSSPVGLASDRPRVPALMCHIFRETSEGLEHRTRFWMGYMLSEGKPKLMLPPGVSVPTFVVQGLARHTVCEFARFKSLLPRIYREMGGEITA